MNIFERNSEGKREGAFTNKGAWIVAGASLTFAALMALLPWAYRGFN